MNKRVRLFLLGSVAVLLLAGWFLFQMLNGSVSFETGEGSFQAWIWEKRSLDLGIQVLLVFSGALGIAAILPMEKDDDA